MRIWLQRQLGRIAIGALFFLPAVIAAACVFLGGTIPRQEPPLG